MTEPHVFVVCYVEGQITKQIGLHYKKRQMSERAVVSCIHRFQWDKKGTGAASSRTGFRQAGVIRALTFYFLHCHIGSLILVLLFQDVLILEEDAEAVEKHKNHRRGHERLSAL